MKRMLQKILMSSCALLLLAQCAYNPRIDTRGRSGTYDTDRAAEITTDIQICREFADQHTFRTYDSLSWAWGQYLHYVSLGLIPDRELKYNSRVDQCLQGRGHSVIR
jgi:hypothetical protein